MAPKERKALGKGFSALLKPSSEFTSEIDSKENLRVSVDKISLNPKQPRHYFDQTGLEELSQSIQTKGLIQPIIVRLHPENVERYELVAGERRLKALKMAGLEEIPVLVQEVDDHELLEIALIENIQRQDLNPLEEAIAYQNLLKEHGYTQSDLATRVGKNRSTIANLIRLLQLPEEIQKHIADSTLSVGHARALLALEEEEDQLNVKNQILAKSLSVRETELIIRKILNPPESKAVDSFFSDVLQAQMVLNENRLAERFATKTNIKNLGNKGKIEIEFYNQEDFNRIFALLMERQ